MEFDGSFNREDFPFLASLFPENNSNSTFKPDLGGSTFPFPGEASASASSSKALVHDFILNQDHVSHNSTPGDTNGGSRSSNPNHFLHLPIDGSSKNPFFDYSSTCTNPFADPYTDGFSSDHNAYIPSFSFTVPDHGAASNNGLNFQAFQNIEPRWDFSQNKPSAQQPLLSPPETDERRSYQKRDQTPPPRPVAARVGAEFSHVNTADQNENNNNNNNEVDENNNRRPHKSPRLSRAVRKTNVVKGQWTPQEDRLLIQLVSRYGTKRWSQIAKLLDERVGKQCRERWHNHLRPDIKKDSWSEEEDMILIAAHREMGNKWAEIAKRLPGRSENTIKNHWNAAKRRQNSRRKTKDGASPEPTILQHYIKSISSTSASTSTSTSPLTTQHDNARMVFEITNPETITNPHLVQLENSGFSPTGWGHIRRHRQQQEQERQEQQQQMDYNAYNDQSNQSFGSMIGEASSSNAMENLDMEMDSLRKEMDFLEMISQGNL